MLPTKRIELHDTDPAYTRPDADLLDMVGALTRPVREHSQVAQLIQLRYFGGLSRRRRRGGRQSHSGAYAP